MNKAEVLHFHAKLWDAAKKEVPTQNIMECYCVCVGLQNKTHMFREYFLSFIASKNAEKFEFTKEATGKTLAILCRRYNNYHDAANLYSQTIKPSAKTCVF